MAQHIGSTEDLHNHLVLFSSRAQNSLDSELWRSGVADTVQQFPQSAGGNWGFIFRGLDLIRDVVLFLLLKITQRSVVLIIFIFLLVAFFFLLLVLFLLMVIIVVVILWQFLSFLRVFSRRYRDYYIKVVLLLRNVLRRVGLRLWLRWHIP
jgi:ABC-type bacteriocin/lantibiotic exporter with double-glycine peptidase domain